MNIDKVFESKYLSAKDLDDDVVVTISKVQLEEISEGQKKPVAYFEEFGKKGMVLNKTNAQAIAQLLDSADTDDWEGQKVGLFVTTVPFEGKNVEAIRVKGRRPKTEAAAAPKGERQRERSKPVNDDDDLPI